MDRSTIVAFHFPHKTASMFAFKMMRSIADRFGLPLFSQNNHPANQAEIVSCVTLDSPLHGKFRSADQGRNTTWQHRCVSVCDRICSISWGPWRFNRMIALISPRQ
ncbi:hypothetical protein U5801_25605 [Lamprobacter modestohalophilus]|nr:hypothetical protein [Lamprobacter modestohalophilus]